MSKAKLLKLINSKKTKRDAMVTRSQSSEDIAEVRSLAVDIEEANSEIVELRSLHDSMPDENPEGWQEPEQRSENPSAGQGFNPLASFSQGQGQEQRSSNEDMFDTMEYRQAFKDYVVKGTPIPTKFANTEARADSLSMVGDVGAVIPTTILNKVIEDMTVEGKILSKVTQTSIQGGVAIPLSDINPTATWLGSETSKSDEQKAKMDAKITFGYHVLEAKVAISLLAATVSLGVFESTVIKQLKKAMITAIETAIVQGTGLGQPLGFIKQELPTENVILMKQDEIGTVTKWAEVEGSIAEAVEDELIYVMAKPTWEKYLNGMVDTTGQKIGLGKINEKGVKILNGREVLTLDKLPGYDTAKNGDVFGAVINLTQYMLNSNLSMYYKKYYNEDENKWIHKSLMIVDGKMCMGKTTDNKIVGAQNLILLKKDTSATRLNRSQQKVLDAAMKEAAGIEQ